MYLYYRYCTSSNIIGFLRKIIVFRILLCFRILFMRDGAGRAEEVTAFRHVLRVERFTSYGLLSRSASSLRIAYHENQRKQQSSRRSIASAAPASTKTATDEREKLRPSRRSRRSVDECANDAAAFTVCVKEEVALWEALLIELWCGNLAATHLRDPQLIQQAAENTLIVNAYILAGIHVLLLFS